MCHEQNDYMLKKQLFHVECSMAPYKFYMILLHDVIYKSTGRTETSVNMLKLLFCRLFHFSDDCSDLVLIDQSTSNVLL